MNVGSDAMCVLVVDDNPADALVISEAIEQAAPDAIVRFAENGALALDYLRRDGSYVDAERPDLMFLDINMPQVNGHQVLAELKADPDLRSIPVVMLTSSDAQVDIRAAYDRHVNAYLTKGFDFIEMQALVRETVEFWLTKVERVSA